MGSNNSVDGLLSQINDVGTVAPGRRADLIVCRGNPLTDLSALHDVAHVMADGNEVA
jgi:imidazolonepropionase-like amidohydrolase